MTVKPDWLLFEAEVNALLDCLRQPRSVRLTAVPFHSLGKQGWLMKGAQAFDGAVERIETAVGRKIGPAVAEQPINTLLLKQGFRELRQALEALRGLVVAAQALEGSGNASRAIGRCLRESASDVVDQVEAWLGKVHGVLIDPVTAVESRGLKAQGDVTLDLPLSLKPSPALQRLQDMVRAHQEAQEAQEALEYSPDPPQPGWLKFMFWLLFLWLLVVLLW